MLAGGAAWAAPAITRISPAAASHTSVTYQSLQYLVTRTGNGSCTLAQVATTTLDTGSPACNPPNFAAGQSTATNATTAALTANCGQQTGSGNRLNTVTFTIGDGSTSCHFVPGNPPLARDSGDLQCTTGTVVTGSNPKTAQGLPLLDRDTSESAVIRLVISCP